MKCFFFFILLITTQLALSSAQENICGSQGNGKTCTQLGFPTYCCSAYGYCGSESGYCGSGCQQVASNGNCYSSSSSPTPTSTSGSPSPPATSTSGSSTTSIQGFCSGKSNGDYCSPTSQSAFVSCPLEQNRPCSSGLVCQQNSPGVVYCVQPTSSTPSTSTTSTSSKATATTATAATTTSTTSTTGTTTVSPGGVLLRRVIYILTTFDGSDIGSTIRGAVDLGFTHILLAFWVNNIPACQRCAADAAQLWQNYADKSSVLSYAHSRNSFIMISGGGATDSWPVDQGQSIGTALAQWAVTNQLDGVDFDIEKVEANTEIAQFQNAAYYQAIADMLIAATTAARNVLPAGKLISHAPQAPYFDPSYGNVYDKVLNAVGSQIDFVNIQFYNQLSGCYQTYSQYFTLSSSNNCFVGASINEIHNRLNFPLSKLVVGTYITDGSGFHDPAQFKQWFQTAYSTLGWNGGIMIWRNGESKSQTSTFVRAVYP